MGFGGRDTGWATPGNPRLSDNLVLVIIFPFQTISLNRGLGVPPCTHSHLVHVNTSPTPVMSQSISLPGPSTPPSVSIPPSSSSVPPSSDCSSSSSCQRPIPTQISSSPLLLPTSQAPYRQLRWEAISRESSDSLNIHCCAPRPWER